MTVHVSVPATIANLGPGFDVLGMAVQLHDRITMAVDEETSAAFTGPRAAGLGEVHRPLVARAAEAVAQEAGRRERFRITVACAIPVARGLGSSAASVVGGLVAANHLLGGPLPQERLLALAAGIEGHPDNVAPALLGGVVAVVADEEGLHPARFLPRADLDVVVAVPEIGVATAEARALLPATVPHADAVFNVGRAALLVAALLTGEERLLRPAMRDRLHQPYRARLVPGLPEVLAAAEAAGAYGAVLAGSGSSVAALAPPERSERVGAAMVDVFARRGIAAELLLTQVDPHGAVVHEEVP